MKTITKMPMTASLFSTKTRRYCFARLPLRVASPPDGASASSGIVSSTMWPMPEMAVGVVRPSSAWLAIANPRVGYGVEDVGE
jgi:hypothetical protein